MERKYSTTSEVYSIRTPVEKLCP